MGLRDAGPKCKRHRSTAFGLESQGGGVAGVV